MPEPSWEHEQSRLGVLMQGGTPMGLGQGVLICGVGGDPMMYGCLYEPGVASCTALQRSSICTFSFVAVLHSMGSRAPFAFQNKGIPL